MLATKRLTTSQTIAAVTVGTITLTVAIAASAWVPSNQVSCGTTIYVRNTLDTLHTLTSHTHSYHSC